MGNVVKGVSDNVESANAVSEMEEDSADNHTPNEELSDDEQDRIRRQKDMDEFKKQLETKRKQRRDILQRHRIAKENLESQLEVERRSKLALYDHNKALLLFISQNNIEIPEHLSSHNAESEIVKTILMMKSEFEVLKDSNSKLRGDLVKSQSALREAYVDLAELRGENIESNKQISYLKEAIAACKTMVGIREDQLVELKRRLSEIETSLAEREARMMSTELKEEYERQLSNIRRLRGLYEERARLADLTRRRLLSEMEDYKHLLRVEVDKCVSLTAKLESSEETVRSLEHTVADQGDEITSCRRELDNLRQEMNSNNRVFSQMLLGYKTGHDLDKLGLLLKENHSLLTDIAGGESDNPTALPKMLMQLVHQLEVLEPHKHDDELNLDASDETERSTKTADNPSDYKALSPDEIIQNLPKVWRVLTELLSHYAVEDSAEDNQTEKVSTCYKSVETKSGPVLVPSVSQTYTRLKDLIIEKLSLVREVNHMKQLNVHLESRLGEQERRLCLVTTELTKTWHVVSKLRKHHHQLHTHEKILKYELQQKRKLLNGLKVELEYCREKWKQAQEKNCQSEKDWRKLRAEFSSRKTKHSTSNYSAESGFSDDKCTDESSESFDESESKTDPFVRSEKKSHKLFETDLDSSVDLYAERDDPTSDMIDVADLSLDVNCDIQDDDTRITESIINDTNSANKLGTQNDLPTPVIENAQNVSFEVNCDECDDNQPSGFNSLLRNIPSTSDSSNNTGCNLDSADVKVEVLELDTKSIHESIRNQNQRLKEREDKLKNMENGCQYILKTIGEKINVGDKMIEKLDSIHEKLNANTDNSQITINAEKHTIDGSEFSEKIIIADSQYTDENDNKEQNTSSSQFDNTEPSTSAEDNEEARFAARDIRLKRLEEQTKRLVTKVNNTTTKAVKINYKLEELHNIYGSENSRGGSPLEGGEGEADVEEDDEDDTKDI